MIPLFGSGFLLNVVMIPFLIFALAAIGSSVLFPTLLSRAVRDVPADRRRGRARGHSPAWSSALCSDWR